MPATAPRRKPIPPVQLMELEKMRSNLEHNLRRSEERALEYRLRLDALTIALERLA